MPNPKSEADDFTKIDENGDSEHEATAPPELVPQAPPSQSAYNIFEPSSRDASMIDTNQQHKTIDKLKSLLFGCLGCYKSNETIRAPITESSIKKQVLKYENS